MPAPLFQRASTFSMVQPAAVIAWIAPLWAGFAYFSTMMLRISTLLALPAKAKTAAVTSTLRRVGSSEK
jgi:hypothetical protein